ncbi:MAG: carbohydrate ABC transporter permease [Myxococcota bacterium]|nr:carbohydrate ABC transporter permease [Myxococcota bacterium]
MGKAALRVLAASLCTLPFAAPLLLMVGASLRDPQSPLPGGFAPLPSAPSLAAFTAAFEAVPLANALWQSTWIAAVAVPPSLLTASWAGLGVALAKGRWRNLLLGVTLLLLVVPATATWLTRFALFKSLGWVGTPLPVLAPALMGGAPLLVLLYADAFRRIPSELLDSARVEGASLLRVWWSIALPQVRPTSAAVGLLAFAASWTGFLDPLLYLHREEQLTAPLMLQHLELLGSTQWSVLMAGAVVVTLPAVVAFAFAGRGLFEERRGTGWLQG